jgi:hypothetical protein
MDVVHKVDRATDVGQAASRVDSVLPVVQFVVVLEGKKISFMEACFNYQAVSSCIGAFDAGYIAQFDSDTDMGMLKTLSSKSFA